MITYDDFSKLEIRIGTILSAERVEGSEKLMKLEVELGSLPETSSEEPQSEASESIPEKRQILAGIAKYYTPEELVGKQIPILANLEPRKMMGLESQGMILAADKDGAPVLLHPDKEVPNGSTVR